jgi:hypothetical protein
MQDHPFMEYLKKIGCSENSIRYSIKVVSEFECYLKENHLDFETLVQSEVEVYLEYLVDRKEDELDRLIALARYGRHHHQIALFTAMLSLLDGGEVMGNFHKALKENLGEQATERIFEGIEFPGWGTDNRKKAKAMGIVMHRLETTTEKVKWEPILLQCLRDLPDAMYSKQVELFQQCADIEEYLDKREEQFLAEMGRLNESGQLYFGQPITNSVLLFLQNNPQISRGVIKNGKLHIVKIPYMTDRWLHAQNEEEKRYFYCHCPWARESIKSNNGIPLVSSHFCSCSAGFVKKPFELIYNQTLHTDIVQSILKGDDVCEFAIVLPKESRG